MDGLLIFKKLNLPLFIKTKTSSLQSESNVLPSKLVGTSLATRHSEFQ